MTIRAAGARVDRRDQLGAGGRFILDERDGAGDRPGITSQDTRSASAHRCSQLPRDDEPLNLARAFADRRELDVAEVFLRRIVLHEAVAAVNLARCPRTARTAISLEYSLAIAASSVVRLPACFIDAAR